MERFLKLFWFPRPPSEEPIESVFKKCSKNLEGRIELTIGPSQLN